VTRATVVSGPLAVPPEATRDRDVPRNVGGWAYGCVVDEPELTLPTPSGRKSLALSPSRAGDFMQCPLLYRFRVIDRLPEPPTTATARGTLVHSVLERLFDQPAAGRTPDFAQQTVLPEWEKLSESTPEIPALFADDGELQEWLGEVRASVDGYFTLEDPRRLEPAEREWYVETELESGLRLRGYVDRLDVAPTGEIRVVDYKTGKAPREDYESSALFQMKFYALVIWKLRGEIPRLLQLMYLADGKVLRYAPDEADLRATERKLDALWKAIQRARDTGDWRPRPSKLCGWCNHQALCPEFGGTLPPLPGSSDETVSEPVGGNAG